MKSIEPTSGLNAQCFAASLTKLATAYFASRARGRVRVHIAYAGMVDTSFTLHTV